MKQREAINADLLNVESLTLLVIYSCLRQKIAGDFLCYTAVNKWSSLVNREKHCELVRMVDYR
ncbi:MAG: hypothetical protein DRR06_08910 [Gammaproteobacteria bacterium]|nr:MAG: hypothetical protein DRR06_08910 [Gammaproteobacteria bacterium]